MPDVGAFAIGHSRAEVAAPFTTRRARASSAVRAVLRATGRRGPAWSTASPCPIVGLVARPALHRAHRAAGSSRATSTREERERRAPTSDSSQAEGAGMVAGPRAGKQRAPRHADRRRRAGSRRWHRVPRHHARPAAHGDDHRSRRQRVATRRDMRECAPTLIHRQDRPDHAHRHETGTAAHYLTWRPPGSPWTRRRMSGLKDRRRSQSPCLLASSSARLGGRPALACR